MIKNKAAFSVRFEDNKFDRKDGVMAIVYALYIMVYIFFVGWLMFFTPFYSGLSSYFPDKRLYKFIFYIFISLFELLPVFIYLKLRKQSLGSIGFSKENNVKSVLLGVLFSTPFIAPNIIEAAQRGMRIIDTSSLVFLFFYYLLEIALVEEIACRGFIQTRIQGLIKQKWLSILVVGFWFSAMHIPFQMLKANMPFAQFVARDAVHLATTFVLHIYFVYIYTRHNNITAAVVTHTLTDFIPDIFIL